MRKTLSWPRRWHGWLAIVLALPFLLLAITGVFFAHGNALGFRQIYVSATPWPGYPQAGTLEIRAAARSGDVWWLATSQGLVKAENGSAVVASDLGDAEVKILQATPQGVLAIAGDGLWREEQGSWKRILKGVVTQANGDAQVLTAVLKGKGVQVSADGGQTWNPLEPAIKPALATLPVSQKPAEVTLSQLVKDLHTGKALFTDKFSWIWQDLMGFVLCFLAFSGAYMWWIRRRALS